MVERAITHYSKGSHARALFLYNALGRDATIVKANSPNYQRIPLPSWKLHEQLAAVAPFLSLYVDKPPLILGIPELIFLDRRQIWFPKGTIFGGLILTGMIV